MRKKINIKGVSKHSWIPTGNKNEWHCNICNLTKKVVSELDSTTNKYASVIKYYKYNIEVKNTGCLLKD